MKDLDALPPADLPLREKLPAMRDATRDALIIWAQQQGAVMPWLLQRGAAYWLRWQDLGGDPGDLFSHSRAIDATCALDLLKWRTEAGADKEAIEHLRALEEHAKHLPP